MSLFILLSLHSATTHFREECSKIRHKEKYFHIKIGATICRWLYRCFISRWCLFAFLIAKWFKLMSNNMCYLGQSRNHACFIQNQPRNGFPLSRRDARVHLVLHILPPTSEKYKPEKCNAVIWRVRNAANCRKWRQTLAAKYPK